MDCRRMVSSIVAFFVLSAGLRAADTPEIKALHKEIDALRAQEKVTIKAIRAQYETFLKIDKLSEKELIAQRDALHQQEKELLSVATTTEDKDAIKAQYGALRDALNKGAKLDASEIRAIRDQEKAHTKLVSAAYGSKIKELETAIQLLKGGKK